MTECDGTSGCFLLAGSNDTNAAAAATAAVAAADGGSNVADNLIFTSSVPYLLSLFVIVLSNVVNAYII